VNVAQLLNFAFYYSQLCARVYLHAVLVPAVLSAGGGGDGVGVGVGGETAAAAGTSSGGAGFDVRGDAYVELGRAVRFASMATALQAVNVFLNWFKLIG
jgi:hypothetical protein